jgi:hypothetical protein
MNEYLIQATVGIILLVLGIVAICKGYKERDFMLLWVGVLTFAAMELLIVTSSKDFFEDPVIPVVKDDALTKEE